MYAIRSYYAIPYNLFKGDLKLSPNPFTEPDEICIEVKTETLMSPNLFMETTSNEQTSAWIRTATKQPMILIHSYPDERNKLILFDTEKLLPALESGNFGRRITSYNVCYTKLLRTHRVNIVYSLIYTYSFNIARDFFDTIYAEQDSSCIMSCCCWATKVS